GGRRPAACPLLSRRKRLALKCGRPISTWRRRNDTSPFTPEVKEEEQMRNRIGDLVPLGMALCLMVVGCGQQAPAAGTASSAAAKPATSVADSAASPAACTKPSPAGAASGAAASAAPSGSAS